MIYVQTKKWQIDLSGSNVTFKEENNLFTDDINKSYSLPFTIEGDRELIRKLGLPTFGNIQNVDVAIKCVLFLHDQNFTAVLHILEVQNQRIECNITYGANEMDIMDRNLKDLPWPRIIVDDFGEFANDLTEKFWPDAAFAFPMVYRSDIGEEDNYKDYFKNFVNYYVAGFEGEYLKNIVEEIDGELYYKNENVMAPFPYLLEILRFGFSLEKKSVTGQLFRHDIIKRAVYIPENYLENFKGSEDQSFNFDYAQAHDMLGQDKVSRFVHIIELSQEGDYEIKIDLNFPEVYAEYFELTVDAGGENLKRYFSRYNQVVIEETLEIPIEQADLSEPIKIELILKHTEADISSYNSFSFSRKDGRLNLFPDSFSLANFVPDMTFGEYLNELKNWFNLDITIGGSYVNIDFAAHQFRQKPQRKHSHLEKEDATWSYNSDRIYHLSYKDGEELYYANSGRIYGKPSKRDDDIESIEMDVQPITIQRREDIKAGIYPEDNNKIDFAVYGGMINMRPTLSEEDTEKLHLPIVFAEFWEDWIKFRVNSKTLKDSFSCSAYEQIHIDELSYKYDELMIIKKMDKKYVEENEMEVEIEAETL